MGALQIVQMTALYKRIALSAFLGKLNNAFSESREAFAIKHGYNNGLSAYITSEVCNIFLGP